MASQRNHGRQIVKMLLNFCMLLTFFQGFEIMKKSLELF